MTDAENREFYAIRLGMLLGIIHAYHPGQRPLRILDAGCGNGRLAGSLEQCGHAVTGVDFSEEALLRARRSWPRVAFEQAPLQDLDLDRLFDVVLCVDVLFHIIDDQTWSRSLGRLARHCKSSGTLVVTDTWQGRTFSMSNYIVHRSRDVYEAELSQLGFESRRFQPYEYGGNSNAFGVFRRFA